MQAAAGMPRMVAVPSGGAQMGGMQNAAMLSAQGQAGMGQNAQQQGRM
jgi:hypothetical protein